MTSRPMLASGLDAMIASLTVPYRAGASGRAVPVADGQIEVARVTRRPLLLARLRRGLADEALVVAPSVAGETLPPVVFAPYSGEGSILPLHLPDLAGGDTAGPFTVDLQVRRVQGEAAFAATPSGGAALSGDSLGEALEGLVVEGSVGRVLTLMTLEKQRIVRQAREALAMRFLSTARGVALDDLGAGLGVPRLADRDESDDHYRARLRIFSRFRLPTPSGFRAALNGPGSGANAGLPAGLGVSARFDVIEDDNELAVTLRLVAGGPEGAAQLSRLHEAMRTLYLFDLDAAPATGLPAEERARREGIRQTLLAQTTRAGTVRYMAPIVASTLERAARLIRRLGHTGAIRIERAYDPAGGSRHELGLGCTLRAFTAAQLTTMAAGVASASAGDDDVAALARGLTPRTPEEDPAGAWIFSGAGFRSVLPVETNRVYLSPLPTFGLEVTGPGNVATGATGDYVASYTAAGVTGVHALVVEAITALPGEFAARGFSAPPEALTGADLTAALQAVAGQSPGALPSDVRRLGASGLVPATASPQLAQSILDSANLAEVAAFRFPHAAISALGTGNALTRALADRVDALHDAGFAAVRGVWDVGADGLLLLASVTSLPGALTRPGEAPGASYLWYAAELPEPASSSTALVEFRQRAGSRAQIAFRRSGVALLATLAYARRGRSDPYEVRIELAEESEQQLLNADQYGFVMNLLSHLYPLGIEINTFDLRKRHVDIDGDGEAEWLTSRSSRTYHRYRQRRPLGFPGGRRPGGE